MQGIRWTRRGFLSFLAVVPVGAACGGSSASSPDGAEPDASADAGPDAPPDAPAHVCADTLPRIDLKADCGAAGDGMTDDTDALQKAADLLAHGGELVIPPGVYRVGRQTAKTSSSQTGPYYTPEPLFRVTGASCLLIRGAGATLQIAPGLRFGGFDAATGAPKDVNGRIQNDAAHVGRVIELIDCVDVTIEGLEIDGNCSELILGGQWGDVDRQTSATGISLNRCSNVSITDVHVHHHGLDGITVLHTGSKPTARKPHTLTRVVSEYNGRQGISWIGGWGLECVDCKFNHTGRAPNGMGVLASKPGAGLDIEPNANTTDITRDGLFTRCEFKDNVGPGMVTAGGDSGYAKFVDCTFWGTTSYSAWPAHPGLEFVTSKFHGTVVRASDGHTPTSPAPNPALATRFDGCTFEDLENETVYRNGYLYTLNTNGSGVTWKNCTFINHGVRSVYIDDPATAEVFDACTFVFANPGIAAGSQQAVFRGSKLVGCHFMESSEVTLGTRSYFIDVASVEVLASTTPTHVDGPRVHWDTPTGRTGDIPPGTY